VNISSYNITDTGYHLIGLRVLSGMPPGSSREQQSAAISRNVLKYTTDKALRLMLPAPKGTFETIGDKICQELIHFKLAQSTYGKGLELTEAGKGLVTLLNERQHVELRRQLVELHLKTYDNLRYILQRHLELSAIYMPVVEARNVNKGTSAIDYLYPTFGEEASAVAASVADRLERVTASKMEDTLRAAILQRVFPDIKASVALSRSIFDRLVSLRLLNIMKVVEGDCEFAKSYSPCRLEATEDNWHTRLRIELPTNQVYELFFAEPDMSDLGMQQRLLTAIDQSLEKLVPKAGYYDLPELRDLACEKLMIPEAAFDEGVNVLLDQQPAPVTVGLVYEGISARRKPLIRSRESKQIFNLIRRV
jgi:hypothetical protein